MKNKKVVSIVLNAFKNDSRVLKENISLQEAGYDVTVVALHEEPLKEFEDLQKIPVHRVKLASRHWSKNKVVQLLKYFEFLYKVVKRYRRHDLFHCNDLNALPVGVIIKKFFNKEAKVIYDAHEYETERNGLKGFQKRAAQFLERLLIKEADRVITVSDAIAEEYVRLYGIERPTVVLNTPPLQSVEKADLFRKRFEIDQDTTIFLYQGNLSRGRGVETVIESFRRLEGTQSALVIMGYGLLQREIEKIAEQTPNIFFHPAVTPDVLLTYTGSADFGIATIEDTCLSYHFCLPNKMFEYIMADLPVIVSDLPEMKKVIARYGVGVVARENSPEAIIEAIDKALKLDREDVQKGLQSVKSLYNWEHQQQRLLELYRDL